MIRIFICDDDRSCLEKLYNMVKDFLFKSAFGEYEYDICLYDKPAEFILNLETRTPDILFLDIDMPIINGFDIAERVAKQAAIVFVSNYDNFVFTSLKYHPLRYLRKSKMDTEFNEAFCAALQEVVMHNECITLDDNYYNKSIFYSEIQYAESVKNYAVLHCDYGEEYSLRSTISALEQKLSKHIFFRCHRAFLVNLSKVLRVENNVVVLSSGVRINISRSNKKAFIEAYSSYFRK